MKMFPFGIKLFLGPALLQLMCEEGSLAAQKHFTFSIEPFYVHPDLALHASS